MKIVVFDLDETLGYFTEFGIFWDCLAQYFQKTNKKSLTQQNFDDILDLFPEFLRPNIINILLYLKEKKQSKCCHKMMIYTNNNGHKEWADHIIKYFEKKINFKIIDQLIAAFKINGKNVEICRTTHNKTHKDFIRCTKIPANAEICFLDDTFYPEMANDHIYYINIKPYYYDLEIDFMLKKFKESNVGNKLINGDENFEYIMKEYIKVFKYTCINKDLKEYEIDKILGKHIVTHLDEFFNNKPKKNTTFRRGFNVKHNKTKKKF
jgi:hypothetical protein